MDTTLAPTTPAEAFARARAALNEHEALIPGLYARLGPEMADTHRLIVTLLRAQVTAAEAVVTFCPGADAAFSAGWSTGMLTAMVAAATDHMPESVKP